MSTIRESIYLSTKKWGMEEVFVNNNMYCGKRMTVMPGCACSVHYHKAKVETFVVLTGKLVLEIYALADSDSQKPKTKLVERRELFPGRPITILPFTPHRFWTAYTPVQFLEFSTNDKAEDSIRLVKAGPTPKNYTLGDPW